jgi:lipopolysaccharide transport system permease protein
MALWSAPVVEVAGTSSPARVGPFAPGLRLARLLSANRQVLVATTRVELEKRYSGSLLGRSWIILYPVLWLAIYLFVYLVVFKVRYPSFSTLEYVVYIFSGLVPYIAIMEAVTAGVVSVKQNLHLVRNIILPVEMIPARAVGMAFVSELVGLLMLVILDLVSGSGTARLAVLVLAVAIELVYLMGMAMFLAPLGVLFPDIGYFTNLAVLFVLFVSPIAFKPAALPVGYHFIVWINPIYYLLLPFRLATLPATGWDWASLLAAGAIAVITYFVGTAFFARTKPYLVDYD